jgi:Flp pilus assembly CpaE family ATPase
VAAPVTAGPHPAPSPAPPSPDTTPAPPSPDTTPALLHPSLARVVVAIRDMPLHQEVLDFAFRDGRIDVVGSMADVEPLTDALRAGAMDAVVCCPGIAAALTDEGMTGASRKDVERARFCVVAPELTVPMLRGAIALGAEGAFRWPEERRALVERVRRRRHDGRSAGSTAGSVIAVHGARGGAGATFVACQLAASVAATGVPTALVDGSLTFSDVTAALGIPGDEEARTITDLIPVLDELSPEHVSRVLHAHTAGFSALLGPAADAPEGPAPGLIPAVIASLRESFGMIVVHTPRSTDAATLAALDAADAVLLVTTLDLFSLYGGKRALQRIARPHPQRARIVVNKATRGSIRVSDVERVLGAAPIASIRLDPAVPRAQERGELLGPHSGRAVRDVERLASLVLEDLGPETAEVS